MNNKKRKCEQEHESEKSLYHQFQHAANSVTSLFQMASSQKAQGSLEGQLKLLDRIQYWVMQQEGQALNRDVLSSFLQMEMQMVEQQLKNHAIKQQAANLHVQNVFPIANQTTFPGRSRGAVKESGQELCKFNMDFEEDNQGQRTK